MGRVCGPCFGICVSCRFRVAPKNYQYHGLRFLVSIGHRVPEVNLNMICCASFRPLHHRIPLYTPVGCVDCEP